MLAILLCSHVGTAARSTSGSPTRVIWPHAGARFVEVASTLDQPRSLGGRLVVVIGGLNRKSGTDIALALLPGLGGVDTRLFSLVYGSEIAERDVVDKFDVLVADVRPRIVDFYGSSMGGDIALILAAHSQVVRDHAEADATAAGLHIDGSRGVAGPAAAGAGPLSMPLPLPLPTASNPAATGSATEPAANATSASILPIPAGTGVLSLPSVVTGQPSAGWPLPLRLPPAVGSIYLDCTPLGPQDVRDPGRTRADAITGLTEAFGTEGGAVVRLAAEILAQQSEWSTGRFPFIDVRWSDLEYKVNQVMREKIGRAGISTRLVKDQYGVIRRMNAGELIAALRPGTRIVFLRPDDPADDPVIRVDRVEQNLLALAVATGVEVTIAPVPAGQHASADSQPDQYRGALARATAPTR